MFKHSFEEFFHFCTALPVTFVAMIMVWFISINDYTSRRSLCDAGKPPTPLSTREPKQIDVKKKVHANLGYFTRSSTWVLQSTRLYTAFHVLRANLPLTSVVAACTQLNTMNLVHKQQREPFQNACHRSLSEWKTNIQTIHSMETREWAMRVCIGSISLVSLQRTGRKAHFIPFSSVRLGRHSGLSGGIFLISCFRSVVPVKDRKIWNSEQADKTVYTVT